MQFKPNRFDRHRTGARRMRDRRVVPEPKQKPEAIAAQQKEDTERGLSESSWMNEVVSGIDHEINREEERLKGEAHQIKEQQEALAEKRSFVMRQLDRIRGWFGEANSASAELKEKSVANQQAQEALATVREQVAVAATVLSESESAVNELQAKAARGEAVDHAEMKKLQEEEARMQRYIESIQKDIALDEQAVRAMDKRDAAMLEQPTQPIESRMPREYHEAPTQAPDTQGIVPLGERDTAVLREEAPTNTLFNEADTVAEAKEVFEADTTELFSPEQLASLSAEHQEAHRAVTHMIERIEGERSQAQQNVDAVARLREDLKEKARTTRARLRREEEKVAKLEVTLNELRRLQRQVEKNPPTAIVEKFIKPRLYHRELELNREHNVEVFQDGDPRMNVDPTLAQQVMDAIDIQYGVMERLVEQVDEAEAPTVTLEEAGTVVDLDRERMIRAKSTEARNARTREVFDAIAGVFAAGVEHTQRTQIAESLRGQTITLKGQEFTFGSPIAAGGMGVVMEAWTENGKQVAVKLSAPYRYNDLLTESNKGYNGRAQLREIAALKALGGGDDSASPFVTSVMNTQVVRPLENSAAATGMAAHELPRISAMVMEHMDGTAMNKAAKRMEAQPLVSTMRDAVSAVRQMHEKGVYHRDLKMQNFLVADDGTVRLFDFGLAVNPEQAGVQQAANERRQARGTSVLPEYAAPDNGFQGTISYTPPYELLFTRDQIMEQLSGMSPQEQLTHMARQRDLFAVGVMLERAIRSLRAAAPEEFDSQQQRTQMDETLQYLVARLVVENGSLDPVEVPLQLSQVESMLSDVSQIEPFIGSDHMAYYLDKFAEIRSQRLEARTQAKEALARQSSNQLAA